MQYAKRIRYKWIMVAVAAAVLLGYAVEVGTAMIRGYGFVFAVERYRDPRHDVFVELWKLREYIISLQAEDRDSPGWQWPSVLEVDNDAPGWRLMHDIRINDTGLYSTGVPSWNVLYKQPGDLNWARGSTVLACTMAHYEQPPGEYHPYPRYPSFFLERLGGERWFVLLTDLQFVEIASAYPPVPGAIYSEGKILYPDEVLASVHDIYPNLEVPEDRIIRARR